MLELGDVLRGEKLEESPQLIQIETHVLPAARAP
jgi:hypothetical protein